MSTTMKVAAIQINSGDEKEGNLRKAASLVDDAARQGAQIAVLPETFSYMGPKDRYEEMAEPIPGPTIWAMAQKAREHRIYLLAGSILEQAEGQSKFFNTSVLLGPSGDILARYRKIHLFDVEVGGRRYVESDLVAPGAEIVVAEAGGVRVGLSICYDLRFPELYRQLALGGARLMLVPAAFTLQTGRDHWEVLLRARAIENQAFVIGAGQVGRAPSGLVCYGRSMIVDPWGIILAQAPDVETAIVTQLSLDELERVRREFPALQHRRPDIYGPPHSRID